MRYEDIEIGKQYVVTGHTTSGHFFEIGDVVEVLYKTKRNEVEISCILVKGTLHQLLRPEELGKL